MGQKWRSSWLPSVWGSAMIACQSRTPEVCLPTRRFSLRSQLLLPLLLLGPLFGQDKLVETNARLTYAQARSRRGVNFRARVPLATFAADGKSILLIEGPKATRVDLATGKRSEAPADEVRAALKRMLPRRAFGRRGALRRRGAAPIPGARLAKASPDGRQIACVKNHDLWVFDKANKTARQLTRGGSENVLNGELDWVYQEEVYGRGTYRAHWWSPDSKHLAFLSLLERDVPRFAIANPVPRQLGKVVQFQPRVTMQRYPKPGQPNPVAKLGVVDLEGHVRWVDLAGTPDDRLVVRVSWTHGGRLLFMVQDRVQTWLELCEADLETGTRTTLIREETKRGWTRRLPMPRWLADGSFLWESERTGRTHVYHYSADAKLLGAVTSGEVGVGRIVRVDEKHAVLWFEGAGKSAAERQLYRVGLDGTGFRRVTKEPGSHRTSIQPGGSLVLDTWSSLADPGAVVLRDAHGLVLRELAKATVAAAATYATGKWEAIQIAARDGHPLDVALLTPVGFRASRTYPVWLPTYSGPHAPTVRNAWNGSAWYQFLAQQGFLVLQVNVRSANPREFADDGRACYRQLGVQELRDLEDAIAWVVAHRSGDAARVGISGWSYGGFMAAFAATHSKAFKLAVAGAGVYDWRLYDTIYTERYMSTPKDNPDGYAKTSCILAANRLHSHLVLMHGTQDDNVHFQNTLEFVYALQRAGKDFELMIFPNSTHGVRGPQGNQRQRIEWNAMRRILLTP